MLIEPSFSKSKNNLLTKFEVQQVVKSCLKLICKGVNFSIYRNIKAYKMVPSNSRL